MSNKIKTQCYECSSNDTQVIGNELKCNSCGAFFVNSYGAKNEK